jgi:hypothetical protein
MSDAQRPDKPLRRTDFRRLRETTLLGGYAWQLNGGRLPSGRST